MMSSNLDWQPCGQHATAFECPDAVIVPTPTGGVGLPVRDGVRADASSWIVVWHCPWCGTRLPDHETHPDPSEPAPSGHAGRRIDPDQ